MDQRIKELLLNHDDQIKKHKVYILDLERDLRNMKLENGPMLDVIQDKIMKQINEKMKVYQEEMTAFQQQQLTDANTKYLLLKQEMDAHAKSHVDEESI